jgi:hypothetical protein
MHVCLHEVVDVRRDMVACRQTGDSELEIVVLGF